MGFQEDNQKAGLMGETRSEDKPSLMAGQEASSNFRTRLEVVQEASGEGRSPLEVRLEMWLLIRTRNQGLEI